MIRKNKFLLFGLIAAIITAGTIGSFIFIIVIQNASPSARYGSTMVYDPILQKAIFFGGGYQDTSGFELFNDMWLFDPTNNLWSESSPTVKPLARSGHSMVYDSFNRKTILFGGWVESEGLMNDTWIYDSQTNQWTEIFPTNTPIRRQGSSLYYDSDAQRVILFGGYKDSLPHYSDTWEFNYSDSSWTELNPTSNPSGRYGSKIVYDPMNQKAILFGGRSSTIMDDTWVYYYGNNSWSELSITSKPDTRYWHSMVYNSNNQEIILFGGRHEGASGEALDDTWIFNPSNNQWTEVLPLSHPSNRMDFSMVYDSNTLKTILFGGFRFPGPTLGDTWTFQYASTNWNLVKGSDP